ncbi:MAG: hypothetical protein WBN65_01545 [Gammaproteobacteria bacterium]
MQERKQEKIGWIGGWLGGFIWVFILAIVFFVQGKALQGGVGLLIVCVACAAIVMYSPWRHPQTAYRKLMMPIYMLFLAALLWAIWSFEGPGAMGFNSWWSLLILLPALMPFWTVGKRRWDDGQREHAKP